MTKQVLLRTSERSTFRRCKLKWQWAYIDRYKSNYEHPALSFGSLVHAALALYYIPGKKRGVHPAEAFVELYDKQPINKPLYSEDDESLESRELGIAMLRGYVELYGKEKHVEIIAPEQAFEIDVCDANGKYLFTYLGRMDAVGRNLRNGKIFAYEHKTAKTIDFVHINSGYGEQAMSYWWGATQWLRFLEILGEKETLEQVLFNFLRKGYKDERPQNSDGLYLNMNGSVSKKQPSALFSRQELVFGENEFDSFNFRIRAEAKEMRKIRKGKLEVYKNPTRDCSWDCPFKDPCEVHELGGDYKGILELEYAKHDPYDDYALTNEKT